MRETQAVQRLSAAAALPLAPGRFSLTPAVILRLLRAISAGFVSKYDRFAVLMLARPDLLDADAVASLAEPDREDRMIALSHLAQLHMCGQWDVAVSLIDRATLVPRGRGERTALESGTTLADESF